jgi:hypothetical protein
MDLAVVNMEYQKRDGGVIVVYWKANKTRGKFYAETEGRASFFPDPSKPGFVQYKDLTEQHVINWLYRLYNGTFAQDIEKQLDENLDKQENPPNIIWEIPGYENAPVKVGLPWAQTEE